MFSVDSPDGKIRIDSRALPANHPEAPGSSYGKETGRENSNGVSKYGSETLSVPAGKVLGPVAVVRDVTARWIREKELRQRLAFLEAGQTKS